MKYPFVLPGILAFSNFEGIKVKGRYSPKNSKNFLSSLMADVRGIHNYFYFILHFRMEANREYRLFKDRIFSTVTDEVILMKYDGLTKSYTYATNHLRD